MPNIVVNPRRTKPSDLEEPCASCDRYEETEAELHDVRKALWGNPGMRQHFRRCMYDPRLADPDRADRCPWSQYIGRPIIAITCDVCGSIIRCLNPDDDETVRRLADKHTDGLNTYDVCQTCRNKNLDPSRRRAAVLLSEKGR